MEFIFGNNSVMGSWLSSGLVGVDAGAETQFPGQLIFNIENLKARVSKYTCFDINYSTCHSRT